MIERKIKELAIALEALSRINGYDATSHFNNVSGLLDKAITEAKEQAHPIHTFTPPPAGVHTGNDDDIPF